MSLVISETIRDKPYKISKFSKYFFIINICLKKLQTVFLSGGEKISMFLKALARDLYKSQKEVEDLEQKLLEVSAVAEKDQLKEQLRQAEAELAQIKKVMEGRKEQSRASRYKPKSRF